MKKQHQNKASHYSISYLLYPPFIWKKKIEEKEEEKEQKKNITQHISVVLFEHYYIGSWEDDSVWFPHFSSKEIIIMIFFLYTYALCYTEELIAAKETK